MEITKNTPFKLFLFIPDLDLCFQADLDQLYQDVEDSLKRSKDLLAETDETEKSVNGMSTFIMKGITHHNSYYNYVVKTNNSCNFYLT